MKGFGRRFFGVVLIGALAFSGLAATSVTPAVASPNVALVGNYRWHQTLETFATKFYVQLNADGTATDKPGPDVGTWSNSHASVTATFVALGFTLVYGGTRTKRGIANEKHPGSIQVKGFTYGYFWAVKIN
jgi:hypothetical protein